MKYEFDDVVTVIDIHGDEERLRVLWTAQSQAGEQTALRVRSLTKSHKKPFNIKCDKIVKHESRKRK